MGKKNVYVKDAKDLKINKEDFIKNNPGKFKDFYSLGSMLGEGKLAICLISIFRCFWRGQKVCKQKDQCSQSSEDHEERSVL